MLDLRRVKGFVEIQCGFCDRTYEGDIDDAYAAGWTALVESDASTLRQFREARRRWYCPDCRSILDAEGQAAEAWVALRDEAARAWEEANPPPVRKEPLLWDTRWREPAE